MTSLQILGTLPWHKHSSERSGQSIIPSHILLRGMMTPPRKHWKQSDESRIERDLYKMRKKKRNIPLYYKGQGYVLNKRSRLHLRRINNYPDLMKHRSSPLSQSLTSSCRSCWGMRHGFPFLTHLNPAPEVHSVSSSHPLQLLPSQIVERGRQLASPWQR